MLQGINLNERIEVISKEDKEEPKTIFVLKPLTALEMLDISKYMQDGKLSFNGEYVRELLCNSIVEIRNPDTKGATNILDFINSQTASVLMEIVVEIGKLNNITEDEKKT